MRLLLVHNPGSGTGKPNEDKLVRQLQGAGHDVEYRSSKKEGWEAGLALPVDAVIVAGGDGTIRKVLTTMAVQGREKLPVALLPLGTANNVARSLGAQASLADLAIKLPEAHRLRLTIGKAEGPWGECRFVESAGLGLFGRMLREARRRAKKKEADKGEARRASTRAELDAKVRAGNRLMHEILADVRTRHYEVTADGKDLSGEYFLVQAMNIASIGPRVSLAPEAAFNDRMLDLVLAGEAERKALSRYFAARARGKSVALDLPVRQVKEVTMSWRRGEGLVDDRGWPDKGVMKKDGALVTISLPSSLPVLLA
jgi:diacylglycerol kinase (ATP)